MTPFQARWIEIGGRLGLRVRAPFLVDLNGATLLVPVLVEGFGAAKGMVLVTAYAEIASFTERLVAAGFGYSCLWDPTEQPLEEDRAIEMLKDWGWSGTGEPPEWYAA